MHNKLHASADPGLVSGLIDEPMIAQRTVANWLNVSEKTVELWRSKGIGPRHHRLNGPRGAIRYRPADVRDWLASNANEEG